MPKRLEPRLPIRIRAIAFAVLVASGCTSGGDRRCEGDCSGGYVSFSLYTDALGSDAGAIAEFFAKPYSPLVPQPLNGACEILEISAEEKVARLERRSIDAGPTVSLEGSAGTIVMQKFFSSPDSFRYSGDAPAASFFEPNRSYLLRGSVDEQFSIDVHTPPSFALQSPTPGTSSVSIPVGSGLPIAWTSSSSEPVTGIYVRKQCGTCTEYQLMCALTGTSGMLSSSDIAAVRALGPGGDDGLFVQRIAEESATNPQFVDPISVRALVIYGFDVTE